ncbi:MAG: T9SS type A sorting domain-containing protein [Ignavibacteriaceae bacterium]|nr:T9SS type A sorting domain-containing protein [Ignavibacteriaceae bacterium]
MKRIITLSILLVVSINFYLLAVDDEKGSVSCSNKKVNTVLLKLESESASGPLHSFDVLDYGLDLDLYNCFISPYPKSFTGSVIVTFKVDSSLNSISLNAVNTSLTIDSVGLSGISFSHLSHILTINLDRTYIPGETTQVKIYYKHNNVSDNAFYVSGGMVFTDCEPEGARKWFPCWDKPSDKATVSLKAKTPASVKLGSNGRLADSTMIGDTIYYHWISRDPVATYLVVISAKVNYGLDILNWVNPSDPNDILPIRFYYNLGEDITAAKQRIIPLTTFFSEVFGKHPFEKNGFATLNNQFAWGGMENQTLTSLCPNCWGEYLMAHEFAHQWFGDMITCATWADIFLNEGFATFSEALWSESKNSYASYKSDINNEANAYLNSNPGWPISNPNWAVTTPSNNQLFNYAITYAKGACVLHLLRYVLGDSIFFTGLKAYANDPSLKYKSAVISDFKEVMSSAANQNLDWFFEQWIFQPNHPIYQNGYYFAQVGSNWEVGFQAKQTQTNTVFFKMPIQLRVSFTSGPDTLIQLMNDVNNQMFFFTFNRQPASIVFDPDNQIVLKTATLQQIPPVPVELTSLSASSNGSIVLLKWSTATEVNNRGFEIERSLTQTLSEGEGFYSWEKIGFVKGNGTSTLPKEYSLVDVVHKFGKYAYRLKQIDFDGSFSYSKEVIVEAGVKPDEFVLEQNYPNPFNPTTFIKFTLPEASKVNLSVYNSLGELVNVLAFGEYEAGTYERVFNASGLASGVYIYVLKTGEVVLKQKMILTK